MASPKPARAPRSQRRASGADAPLDPRWSAVLARDASADGSFFYSVKTTGVYCHPSCGARRPRRENVAFHASAAAAEAAGFRACKRCKPAHARPSERTSVLVASLCRLIDASDPPPTLEQLARHAALSTFHTHRLFKAATGLTPREYAAARRAARLREELKAAPTVTQAIYAAGYNSSGHFYAEAGALLGMTPTQYRSGGAELPLRFAVGKCSLGGVLVAATDRGVCAILLGDDPEALRRDLERRFPRADISAADSSFHALVQRVIALVERPATPASLPLDLRGTTFQQRVWRALAALPPNTTTTYTELAQAIGAPKAARAVARACAANALAVAIPCHRVVGKDGDLCGYRWGVERKRELLRREGAPDGSSSRRAARARKPSAG